MRKITEKLVVAMVLLLLPYEDGFSQQDPQFTNYMYNTQVLNPAYAGTRESLSIMALYRSQWAGLDGAPETATLTLHSPMKRSNLGWGLAVVNDEIGPAIEQTLSFDLTYRIGFDNLSELAFGFKSTAHLLNVDFTKLSVYDPTDPSFQNNVDNRFSPNFGAGFYWYSDRYYLGLSVPNFLRTKHYNDNTQSSTATRSMQCYFMGGYVLDCNDDIQFKPALLTKFVSGAPLQVDLTANFLFFEKITAGAAYRLSGASSFLAGFQVSDRVFIGYSYDTEATRLANYNSGSHEFFLRFELFAPDATLLSPRFF